MLQLAVEGSQLVSQSKANSNEVEVQFPKAGLPRHSGNLWIGLPGGRLDKGRFAALIGMHMKVQGGKWKYAGRDLTGWL